MRNSLPAGTADPNSPVPRAHRVPRKQRLEPAITGSRTSPPGPSPVLPLQCRPGEDLGTQTKVLFNPKTSSMLCWQHPPLLRAWGRGSASLHTCRMVMMYSSPCLSGGGWSSHLRLCCSRMQDRVTF